MKRQKKRLLLVVPLVLVILVILTMTAQAQSAPVVPEPVFVLHAVVDYDSQGVPSMMGMSAQMLAQAGINLPVALEPSMLQWAQTNGITQLKGATLPDGFYIWYNGKELPHLAWTGATLQNLAELLPALGVKIDPRILNPASQIPTKVDLQITFNIAPPAPAD